MFTHRKEPYAEAGDYLYEGPNGDRWPVKKQIFESAYEAIERTGWRIPQIKRK